MPQEHKSSYLISQNPLEIFLSFNRKHKYNSNVSPKLREPSRMLDYVFLQHMRNKEEKKKLGEI